MSQAREGPSSRGDGSSSFSSGTTEAVLPAALQPAPNSCAQLTSLAPEPAVTKRGRPSKKQKTAHLFPVTYARSESGLFSLSEDLLITLFCSFSAESIVALAKTCRTLRRVCQTDILWKRLCKRDFHIITSGPIPTYHEVYQIFYLITVLCKRGFHPRMLPRRMRSSANFASYLWAIAPKKPSFMSLFSLPHAVPIMKAARYWQLADTAILEHYRGTPTTRHAGAATTQMLERGLAFEAAVAAHGSLENLQTVVLQRAAPLRGQLLRKVAQLKEDDRAMIESQELSVTAQNDLRHCFPHGHPLVTKYRYTGTPEARTEAVQFLQAFQVMSRLVANRVLREELRLTPERFGRLVNECAAYMRQKAVNNRLSIDDAIAFFARAKRITDWHMNDRPRDYELHMDLDTLFAVPQAMQYCRTGAPADARAAICAAGRFRILQSWVNSVSSPPGLRLSDIRDAVKQYEQAAALPEFKAFEASGSRKDLQAVQSRLLRNAAAVLQPRVAALLHEANRLDRLRGVKRSAEEAGLAATNDEIADETQTSSSVEDVTAGTEGSPSPTMAMTTTASQIGKHSARARAAAERRAIESRIENLLQRHEVVFTESTRMFNAQTDATTVQDFRTSHANLLAPPPPTIRRAVPPLPPHHHHHIAGRRTRLEEDFFGWQDPWGQLILEGEGSEFDDEDDEDDLSDW